MYTCIPVYVYVLYMLYKRDKTGHPGPADHEALWQHPVDHDHPLRDGRAARCSTIIIIIIIIMV